MVEVVHQEVREAEGGCLARIATTSTKTRTGTDVTGTEPLALHTYVRKLDASVDDAYFAYLYSVLVENPAIKVSLTTDPLAGPDKNVRLGDAPLPDDFQVPDVVRSDVNISDMYVSGIKGRAMAYHLSGEEFKSNSQVIEERRVISKQNEKISKSAALRKKRDEESKKAKPSLGDGLIRDLETDDGEGIPREDLNGLAQRWGSRLRLRCTDEEIYYRLTGSHQKVSLVSYTESSPLMSRSRKSLQSSIIPSLLQPSHARRALLRSSWVR